MSSKLTLFTRSGCSLCDSMHRELLLIAPRLGFELDVVDVDDNETFRRRYNDKVPVLCDAQGTEICHYFLDHQALQSYFATP